MNYVMIFPTILFAMSLGKQFFLEPNPRITNEDQKRAKIIIELYGLNDFDRPEDRYRVWKQFDDSNNPVIDEFAYRFLFM